MIFPIIDSQYSSQVDIYFHLRTTPERLIKSIKHYDQVYASQLKREGIEPAMLRETVIVIYGDVYGMHCLAQAVDDRGTRHEIKVMPS